MAKAACLSIASACGGGQAPEPASGAEPAAASEPAAAEGAAAEGEAAATDEAGERLSFQEALEAAKQRYAQAPAIEVEVEEQEGKTLLEVEFLVDGEIREVYLDPSSGEVVREATEKLEEAEAATLPRLAEVLGEGEITLTKAIDLALERYDEATVREIELEVHEDEVILEVAVHDAGKTVEWVLDPLTGEVRGEETEDTTH